VSDSDWYAPFQTDEINKSLMSGVCLVEDVFKAIYKSNDLRKAEAGTVVEKQKYKAPVSGFEPTQAAPAGSVGKTSKVVGAPHITGELPDVSQRAAVSEPGHKLAMARAHLDHHAYEYHRNNQIAGDTTAHPEHRAQAKTLRDEHQRLGTNAKKVINSFEAQGVKDTKKHHADMVLHYEQNKDNPKYAGGVLHPLQPQGMQLARHHNPRSGSEWDKHYGTPEGIPWHKPEAREAYRKMLDKPYRSAKVKQKPATESLELEPPTVKVEKPVKKSLRLYLDLEKAVGGDIHQRAAHAVVKRDAADYMATSAENPVPYKKAADKHHATVKKLLSQGAAPKSSHFKEVQSHWAGKDHPEHQQRHAIASDYADPNPEHGAAVRLGMFDTRKSQESKKSFPLRPDIISPRPLRKA
jgi:hypothetical protein